MNCRYCENKCVKNGFYKNHIQRYRCRSCKKTQAEQYRYKACERSTNEEIVKLLINGCGIRSISRIKNIATGTVMSRIKSIASKIEKRVVVKSREELHKTL